MSEIIWHEINMTSNTTPVPFVASASLEYNTGTYGVYNMYSTSLNSEWWMSNDVVTGYSQIDFGSPREITHLKIRSSPRTNVYYNPKEFSISGSNDGVKFNIINNYINVAPSKSSEEKIFELAERVKYRYMRINILSSNGDYIMISNLTYGYIPIVKNIILKNPTTNQYYSLAEKTLVSLPDASSKNMILHGIEAGKEIQLDEPFDKIRTVIDNEDDTQTIAEVEVESFSVYDYISENPQVLIYTESTDDIIVSTTTEAYDLYDEFGDEVEVLFYTDDEAVTEADLILEANWSPVDEIEGDFGVVTWTDEPQESAQRVLEMTAIPKPQFIKLVNPKRLYGYLDDILAVDSSVSYRDEVRYFVSGENTSKWYIWDNLSQSFMLADASTNELVLKNGMKHSDLNNITDSQWRVWDEQYMNIGVFLKDNPRDTITSIVDSLSYEDYLPRYSTVIENTSLYILNTTAIINLNIAGSTLTGVLSDKDLTRVQYRVFLNNEPYFPSNGEFTSLGQSPQNIEITFQSKDIKMDDWNTVKVEFQDFFGTTDYWVNRFIGTYSGIMFKDVYGEYYSSEIGEVLQYLDFGIILAGQTTVEHEIILKNQYGYNVENVHLYANTSEFPSGMSIQFSESLAPFLPQNELRFNGVFTNNEEKHFFVKIKTELGATPNANGSFDIIVRADRVD